MRSAPALRADQPTGGNVARVWTVLAAAIVGGAVLIGTVSPTTAQAAEGTTASIDSLRFTTTSVGSGSTADLSGTWSLPDHPSTPAGFTIDLPSALQGLADNFNLTDPDGVVMGSCVVSATQLSCTIDSAYIDAHPLNLKGTFQFSVKETTVVTTPTTETYTVEGHTVSITVTPTRGTCTSNCDFHGLPLQKFGSYNAADKTILWTVVVPAPVTGATAGERFVVTDTPGEHQELQSSYNGVSYAQLWKTNQIARDSYGQQTTTRWAVAPSDTYTATASTASWTGQDHYFYNVKFVTKVTDGGAAGTYTNSVSVEIGDKDGGTVTGTTKTYSGGGTGSGDNTGVVSWQKTDAVTGHALAGSEWSLTGPDGFSETVVDNGSNDVDATAGAVQAAGLNWGDYTLTETKAPAGHTLSKDEHTFTIDAGDTTVDLGTITNRPTTPATSTHAHTPSVTPTPTSTPVGPVVSTGGTTADTAPVWPWVGIGVLGLLVAVTAIVARRRRSGDA